jgi:thiamine pyrophosphate-dependent acetolactate synthase large subunit-like protein
MARISRAQRSQKSRLVRIPSVSQSEGPLVSLIVRDFTKWDDQPITLQHFAESAVRAYKIATTPPMGPVLLSLDGELQENSIPDRQGLNIPKFVKVAPPVGSKTDRRAEPRSILFCVRWPPTLDGP